MKVLPVLALALFSLPAGATTILPFPEEVQTNQHDKVDTSISHPDIDGIQSIRPALLSRNERSAFRFETIEFGSTRYDYQHSASIGKMVAVSEDGVAHMSFMGGTNTGSGRRVLAACIDPDLSLTGPTNVDEHHSGYTTHAATSENPSNGLAPNSGVVANHRSAPGVSEVGVDFMGCTLAFGMTPHAGSDILWPHIAVDYIDQIHMVCADAGTVTPDAVYYDNSSDGMTWNPDYSVVTENCNVIASIPTAAKHAPGAAIVFMQDAPASPLIFASEAPQWHHDVYFYETRETNNDLHSVIEEGSPVNITNYHALNSDAPFKYGVFAYADLDAIYDSADEPVLHIAFETPVSLLDSTLYKIPFDPLGDIVYAEEHVRTDMHSAGWHFNVDTREWGHVFGWLTGDSAEDIAPDPGFLRLSKDRIQLGHDPETGYIYALWNVYSDDDRASEYDGDMPNGELFMACSSDNGKTWGEAVNITDSQTPGCMAGDCMSETFGSLAEVVVDGYLHITFLQDLHAGAYIRMDDGYYGQETVNPMVYMRVPVGAIQPHSGNAWDTAGHVGLLHYERPWSFDEGHFDTLQIIDRIMIFNEGREDLTLTELTMYHLDEDVFGGENLWVEWAALTGSPADNDVEVIENPVDANDWNGQLPAQQVSVMHVSIGHTEIPFGEQAFKFSFSDGTERVYRYTYTPAEGGAALVVELDLDHLEQYTSTSLYVYDVGIDLPELPMSLELERNYPNPFNPTTIIRFNLPEMSLAKVSVYNLLGNRVAVLLDETLEFGQHEVVFNAENMAGGIYFCVLEAAGQRDVIKMTLIK